MTKVKFFAILAVIVVLVTTGFILFPREETAIRPCIVTGDVQNVVSLSELEKAEYIRVKTDYGTVQAIPLATLVEAGQPLSDRFSVLLKGYDGLFARLEGDELEGCYIENADGVWNVIALKHPVNAGIKDLGEIIVVDETGNLDMGVNIISQTENIFHITPGNMVLSELTYYPYLDGNTNMEDGYAISLYKQRKVIALEDVTQEEISSILVMGRQGEYEYSTQPGYLELNNTKINYLQPETRISIHDIAGIIINPPVQSVLDTYADSQYFLDKGDRVMLIYIDGFGYHQYRHALEQGRIPTLAELGSAGRANTVYKPVTNAGYAAMITGRPPKDNGIRNRGSREPKVETIFDWLESEGKSHILIEGNAGILNLNTETILSPDLNGDGSTDAEVFNNALTALQDRHDFVMVHFHGVDDTGHDYGDLDERTIAVLEKVDEYVGILVSEWEGKVIVTADHGMHSSGDAGDHGSFRFEDMFVPYIIK